MWYYNSSIGIIGLASETDNFVGELTKNISYTKTSLVLSKRGYGNGMGRVFDGIRKRGVHRERAKRFHDILLGRI